MNDWLASPIRSKKNDSLFGAVGNSVCQDLSIGTTCYPVRLAVPFQASMEDIPTLLQKILQTKATEVAALKAQRIKIGLPLTVEECAKFDRRFEISLRDSTKIPIIAEIKRKSPSSGRIVDPCIDAVLVAKKYEVSNAACISVLTDQQYFGGSMDDLDNIASAITIPILRKVGYARCIKDIRRGGFS